jgi:hypothetical protein
MGPDFQHKIVSDRFSAYEVLPLKQRGICWAQAVIFSASPGQAAGALGQALLNVSAHLCYVSVIWPVRFQHPRFWNGWTCAEMN